MILPFVNIPDLPLCANLMLVFPDPEYSIRIDPRRQAIKEFSLLRSHRERDQSDWYIDFSNERYNSMT